MTTCPEHKDIVNGLYEIRGLLAQISGSVQELQSDYRIMSDLMRQMETRMFRDNGQKSFQTRIDRTEQTLRGLLWAVGITAATVIAQLVEKII